MEANKNEGLSKVAKQVMKRNTYIICFEIIAVYLGFFDC